MAKNGASYRVSTLQAREALALHPKSALAALSKHEHADVRRVARLLKEKALDEHAPPVRLEFMYARQDGMVPAFAHLVKRSLEENTFDVRRARVARAILTKRAGKPGEKLAGVLALAENMAIMMDHPQFDQVARLYSRRLDERR